MTRCSTKQKVGILEKSTRLLQKMRGSPIDLTGQRFGQLVAISRHGRKWLWRCDCGVEKLIDTNNVKRGLTVSCGHRMRETARERCTKHGHYLAEWIKQLDRWF